MGSADGAYRRSMPRREANRVRTPVGEERARFGQCLFHIGGGERDVDVGGRAFDDQVRLVLGPAAAALARLAPQQLPATGPEIEARDRSTLCVRYGMKKKTHARAVAATRSPSRTQFTHETGAIAVTIPGITNAHMNPSTMVMN
jgi:hypothetical protein